MIKWQLQYSVNNHVPYLLEEHSIVVLGNLFGNCSVVDVVFVEVVVVVASVFPHMTHDTLVAAQSTDRRIQVDSHGPVFYSQVVVDDDDSSSSSEEEGGDVAGGEGGRNSGGFQRQEPSEEDKENGAGRNGFPRSPDKIRPMSDRTVGQRDKENSSFFDPNSPGKFLSSDRPFRSTYFANKSRDLRSSLSVSPNRARRSDRRTPPGPVRSVSRTRTVLADITPDKRRPRRTTFVVSLPYSPCRNTRTVLVLQHYCTRANPLQATGMIQHQCYSTCTTPTTLPRYCRDITTILPRHYHDAAARYFHDDTARSATSTGTFRQSNEDPARRHHPRQTQPGQTAFAEEAPLLLPCPCRNSRTHRRHNPSGIPPHGHQPRRRRGRRGGGGRFSEKENSSTQQTALQKPAHPRRPDPHRPGEAFYCVCGGAKGYVAVSRASRMGRGETVEWVGGRVREAGGARGGRVDGRHGGGQESELAVPRRRRG